MREPRTSKKIFINSVQIQVGLNTLTPGFSCAVLQRKRYGFAGKKCRKFKKKPAILLAGFWVLMHSVLSVLFFNPHANGHNTRQRIAAHVLLKFNGVGSVLRENLVL